MISLGPIGVIQTPFHEKFGIPRQPALAKNIHATLRLDPKKFSANSCLGLADFDYIWLISYFHQAKPSFEFVRPPRLGGNKKMGVFATRSPFRPNPIGLSLAKLEKIENTTLHLSEIDLVDQTPILDIKPYLSHWDSRPLASSGWVKSIDEVPSLSVHYSQEALQFLQQSKNKKLKEQLDTLLSQDPRPAYKSAQLDQKEYFLKFSGHEVAWIIKEEGTFVQKISLL